MTAKVIEGENERNKKLFGRQGDRSASVRVANEFHSGVSV